MISSISGEEKKSQEGWLPFSHSQTLPSTEGKRNKREEKGRNITCCWGCWVPSKICLKSVPWCPAHTSELTWGTSLVWLEGFSSAQGFISHNFEITEPQKHRGWKSPPRPSSKDQAGSLCRGGCRSCPMAVCAA